MLKRDISTLNVLIAGAGSMIGSGWLFSPFISAQIAGPNALISWVIASVFMLFIALPLCELGTMFPISGGMANYPTMTHGKTVGFLFAWITWISYVVMTPIEIQAILQYASFFMPNLIKKGGDLFQLSGLGYVIAITIMLGVAFLNTFGIKLLAECNKYASIFKFVVPSIAIMSLLSIAPSFQNATLNTTTASAWENIFSALSTGGIVFAFAGFQNGLMLAGEVKNPQRNLPIAILGAILVGFVFYFMLQLSFIVAIPHNFLSKGWAALNFPHASSPLVGLTALLGLGIVTKLLMIDASVSPFGTTLVYTAATSRILYGMSLAQHLPPCFLKLNRYKVPSLTLYANVLIGIFSFLPFPSWQKMVAFLSSAGILSYGIGPICLLAMRQLQKDTHRPFKLAYSQFFCHTGFYVCNLMLYWCSFSIIWKLYVAIFIGLTFYLFYHKKKIYSLEKPVYWFCFYLTSIFLVSYLGSFGGLRWIVFPWDILIILPISIAMLKLSQKCLTTEQISFPECENIS